LKTRILYIEDEQFLGRIVKDTLEKKGYEVNWETDGAKVMSSFDYFKPDICVVDIMLPNVDGYTLCRSIRGLYRDLPIIFLTAKTETQDLVKGFEAGGTDYIRKPFSIEELIVRIDNQIALRGGANKDLAGEKQIVLGSYRYSPSSYELQAADKSIKLSHREGQVLNILCSNINHITDRKYLLMAVWGDDSFFNSRTLDVYIRKLRQYLKDDPSLRLQTLKGRGYLFLVPEAQE